MNKLYFNRVNNVKIYYRQLLSIYLLIYNNRSFRNGLNLLKKEKKDEII